MNFQTKKVNTQDLGEYLVAARKRVNLSVEDVFRFTKIQPKYILALEEGRLRDLPDKVYSKGFLRQLAKVYRVDQNKLLAQFADESGIESNLRMLPQEKASSLTPIMPRFVLSPKTITILLVSFLGLLSFAYLYFQVSSLNRPPYLEISSPAEEVADSGLLNVAGRTEPGSQVYLNGQPIVVRADGNFKESLSLGLGTNQLVIKSVNKFGRETELVRQVVYLKKEIAGTRTAKVLMLALKIGPSSSWIELAVDGRVEYSGTMAAGTEKLVAAKEKIRLSTGNAGATRVILNGDDLGVLGKEGEVLKNIEFTPAP